MNNISTLTARMLSIYKTNGDIISFLDKLNIDELVLIASEVNTMYRDGSHVISDREYDNDLIARIAAIDPTHDYLNAVETESEDSEITGKKVTLSSTMLSTSKAYSKDAIEKWLNRILNAADELGIDKNALIIRATPKLDGFAILDDGTGLYTRGNGIRGTDVTRALERGLSTYRDAGHGLGASELVVDPIYFENYLADQFDNTRNVIASVLKESPYTPYIAQAVKDKAVVLAPFAALDDFNSNVNDFLHDFESIIEKTKTSVSFDIDGVIFEVTNEEIKAHLGATKKAHRWMIAFKENEQPVRINVINVTAQTSRNGVVVPVVDLEPTEVSGVTVSRATAHNYKNILNSSIGIGSELGIIRSGLVIPKIVAIYTPKPAHIPELCPSCSESLRWGTKSEGNEYHLICDNTQSCPAQSEKRLLHWFLTLGNVDGFGPATIRQLLEQTNSRSIVDIYKMTRDDFIAGGFGEKTSDNLIAELQRSKVDAIEDYRFLAGFGINKLGTGNCEKLLQHHPLNELLTVPPSELVKIHKVGGIIADYATQGFARIKDDFDALIEMGFTLIFTPLASEFESISSPIAGKTIVFTGTMVTGARKDLEKQAKDLGAKIGKSVSGATDYLVIGEKVGNAKITAAEKHGTIVIKEQDYVALISQ